MKIGILGSGSVAQTLGTGISKLGHDVMLGTSHPEKLKDWHKSNSKSKIGSFNDATSFGEVIFIATHGLSTVSLINTLDKKNFANKTVIDVTNALDFSSGSPKLISSPNNSLVEQIQKALPTSKVVKAFNTIGAATMISPKRKEGDPELFIVGNDVKSKEQVINIAKSLGWKNILDVGDLTHGYLVEALAMIGIDYGIKNNNFNFSFKLLKQ